MLTRLRHNVDYVLYLQPHVSLCTIPGNTTTGVKTYTITTCDVLPHLRPGVTVVVMLHMSHGVALLIAYLIIQTH